MGCWGIVSGLLLTCGAYVAGIRPDLPRVWLGAGYLVQICLLLGIALTAIAAALTLNVPNRQKIWLPLLPLLGLVAWTAIVITSGAMGAQTEAGRGIACVRNILLFSILPGILIGWMLGKGAPMRSGLVGFLAALGTAAMANLATRATCRNDASMHIFVWHLIPVLAIAALGIAIGNCASKHSALAPSTRET